MSREMTGIMGNSIWIVETEDYAHRWVRSLDIPDEFATEAEALHAINAHRFGGAYRATEYRLVNS